MSAEDVFHRCSGEGVVQRCLPSFFFDLLRPSSTFFPLGLLLPQTLPSPSYAEVDAEKKNNGCGKGCGENRQKDKVEFFRPDDVLRRRQRARFERRKIKGLER